jgi:hypothetical protein
MSFGNRLTRSAPMKRSGFKTKPDAKGLSRSTPLAKQSKKVIARALEKGSGKAYSTLKSSRPYVSAADLRYMERVRGLGCICCLACYGIADTPAIVHHLRTGQGKMKAAHTNTMPLCPRHHQDSGVGVHDMGRPQFAALHGKSEVELLHLVQAQLGIPLFQVGYEEI